MGLMSTIFGETGDTREVNEYVELDATIDMEETSADWLVRIAALSDNTDVIEIKDEVYEGNVVIADITRHTTQDRTMEHIIDELKQVTREVGGDIVQKDDDQLIITPAGVAISRERLGK